MNAQQKVILVCALTLFGAPFVLLGLGAWQHNDYLELMHARGRIGTISIVYDDAKLQVEDLPIRRNFSPWVRPAAKEEEGLFNLGKKGYVVVWKDGSEIPDTLVEDYRRIDRAKLAYERDYPIAYALIALVFAWCAGLLIWTGVWVWKHRRRLSL